MALKRRLTDQDYPFLRVIGRRTSRYAVKSVCVPDEEDNDCQSQTGSNDPVYDMILIDYDVEDDVESPVSHEDELKAIIPQLPATIETQKLQAQRQQQQKQKQEKNERQKRKQKQQEENAEWDAVWDYYEKQAQKKQKNQQRKQEQEKQQNMTVIDYDEIESPVSQEDDMIEVGAEEIILEQERLIARKQRHQKQEKKQQMNDVWDEAWCNEY